MLGKKEYNDQKKLNAALAEMTKKGYTAPQSVQGDSDLKKMKRLAAVIMSEKGWEDKIPEEESDAVVGFLKPGASKRQADLNGHWESSLMQDWPHSDIYKPSVMHMVTRDLTTEEAVDKRGRFGDEVDLFYASEDPTKPTEVTDVKVNYGDPKQVGGVDVRELTLDNADEVCRRNLVRILCIYFDEVGLGSSRSQYEMKWEDKQTAMNRGVEVHSGAQEWAVLVTKPGVGAPPSGQQRFVAWKPVFAAQTGKGPHYPPLASEKTAYAAWKKAFKFQTMQNEQKAGISAEVMVLLDKVRSEMTVGEWVTTPFHYEYLPYQPVNAMFQDSETYSMGCLRCSRPFYEHEFVYVSDSNKTKGQCRSWPVSSFEPSGAEMIHEAPLPFSAPEHWGGAEIENTGRPVPWKLFKMQLSEYEKTDRGVSAEVQRGNVFKQTTNYVWRQNAVQKTIWQGRIQKSDSALVHFGMSGLQLRRQNKYCNCCSDCATVLHGAPGLFIKNFRKVPFVKRKADRDAGGESMNDPWWTFLYEEKGLNLKGMDENYWESNDKEKSLGIINAYLQEHHQIKPHLSKFRSAPTIHVQTDFNFSWDRHSKKEENKGPEKANLEAALDTVAGLLSEELDENDKMHTGAFRNLLREIQVKYTHKGQLRSDPVEFGKFDKDEYRIEIRNEVRSDKGGPPGKWMNCLRTQQWLPRHGTVSPLLAGANQRAEDYETRIHYATRTGEGETDVTVGGFRAFRGIAFENTPWNGKATTSHDSTQWAGDSYLLQQNDKGEYVEKPFPPYTKAQYRRKTQSRFFITYSLHRATRGAEARVLLERMANGLYTLFGRDDLLSELIVFGKKIMQLNADVAIHKNTNSDKHKDALSALDRDFLGAGRFGIISKTNKEDKMPEFYAGLGFSSYTSDTYDTHIHSVDVNAGVEIGPKRHHPHFHLLLTIEHWSYIQIDYFKMRQMLEMLFRAQPAPGWFNGGPEIDAYIKRTFWLKDSSGGDFMSDAENPWVDIRLYPQDNWEDIIDDYVKKGSGGVIDSALKRLGPAVYRSEIEKLNKEFLGQQ